LIFVGLSLDNRWKQKWIDDEPANEFDVLRPPVKERETPLKSANRSIRKMSN